MEVSGARKGAAFTVTNSRDLSEEARMDAMKRAALGVALALTSGMAAAQGFPSKPVRIIVSHSAGGPPDVATRGLAPALSQAMGQPFVVENRDGANGIVGTEAVAKSAP